MSTISNERLEKLSSGNAWTCVQDDEAKAMATELLALRKEREYPETLPCPVLLEPCFRLGKGVRTATMLRALQTRAEHQASLDAMTPGQRAEYESGMAAFKAMLSPSSQTTLGQEIEQALKGNLHKLYLDDETDNSDSLAQAETDTTAQQFESLAFNSVVPVGTVKIERDWNTNRNIATVVMREDLVLSEMRDGDVLYTAPPASVVPEGWKLVPIEPTPDMREAFHQANEEWEDGGATWSPDHQWSAMLGAAPEPCK